MNIDALDTHVVLAALSETAGCAVRLRSARLGQSRTFYMVFPADSSQLTQPLWKAVKQSSNQGIWDTPEQAIVGFATQITGWLDQARSPAKCPAVALLQLRLSSGPVAAATLLCEAAEAGISRDRLGRAARRMGVVRRKDGLRGGWLWELPAGKPGTATPAEQREGMV